MVPDDRGRSGRGNQPLRILFVEDSEEDMLLAVAALAQTGHDVTFQRVQGPADLEAALALAIWDAVLSDARTSSLDASGALRILKATTLDIPFIVVSEAIGETSIVEMLRAGASDCILKQDLSRLAPVLERELAEASRRATHRQSECDMPIGEARFRSSPSLVSNRWWDDDEHFRVNSGSPGLWSIRAQGAFDAIGRTPWELSYGGVAWSEHRVTLDANRPVRDLDQRQIHHVGALVHLAIDAGSPFDTDGRSLDDRGIGNDIKENAQQLDDLLRLRAAMDTMADAVYLIDRASMRYVHVNDTACRRLNKTRAELLALGPEHVLSIPRSELEATYDAIIASGEPAPPLEIQRTTHGGQPGWFEIRRHARRIGNRWIIVALVRDITEHRKAVQNLRESERRFSEMLGSVELISLMLDTSARVTYCNKYLLQLTGWQHDEVIGNDWFLQFIPPELQHLKDTLFRAVLANEPEAMHNENVILTRSGEHRLIRWNSSVLRSGDGDVIGLASIGEDITARKAAEERVVHLDRVHAVLRGINTVIVRTEHKDDLFKEACRIAVDAGGFRMSMISIVDPSSSQIVPVATAGKSQDLLNAIEQLLSSRERVEETMVALAIRQKAAVVSNDSQNDARVLIPEKYAESGVRSMAVLPLIVAGDAVGVLALYASELDFFHEGEMTLLTELANDVAFAIDHLQKAERINYLAYYDALTGLANRTFFLERLAQYVDGAASKKHGLAVIVIDLERFKLINESLGRPAGDELLSQVASRFVATSSEAVRFARIGAHHFAVVVPEVVSEEWLVRRIEASLERHFGPLFMVGKTELKVSVRLDVAVFPNDGGTAELLLTKAESAAKRAKAGGERYLFYTQQMTERVAGRLTLENQLRRAIEYEEFVLHYQPKVHLISGRLTGAEALIRWNDPRTGLVAPTRFIPILEETGLINDAGRWALRKAIEDFLRWRSAGLATVRIAVNVSPLQLRHRDFVAEIARGIGIDPHAASGLELEITESLVMDDSVRNIATLTAIRAMGIRISLDDFGTGHSSLSLLAKLPVDTLKVDRSFVVEMTASASGLALIHMIVGLAHALKLNVVAEGVETDEQSRLLRLMHCDEMQGYLFSKPLPCDAFEAKYLAPPMIV